MKKLRQELVAVTALSLAIACGDTTNADTPPAGMVGPWILTTDLAIANGITCRDSIALELTQTDDTLFSGATHGGVETCSDRPGQPYDLDVMDVRGSARPSGAVTLSILWRDVLLASLDGARSDRSHASGHIVGPLVPERGVPWFTGTWAAVRR